MRRQAPHRRRWLLTAAAYVAAAVLACPAGAQPAARLLDVPYLPQSEDLCGGAAAAMVMRYWGARDIYGEAFAPLVDHSAGGIRASALVSALRARGWTALAENGTPDRLDAQLAQGRPVIALVAVGGGRYHYVVVVARTADRTVLHDPARAPLRSEPDEAFDRAWQQSQRWMLTLLPPADVHAAAGESRDLPAPAPPPSCAALVQRGIDAAGSDTGSARALLTQASTACPSSSAPWRELAGVDALEKKWADAARHAATAVARDRTDAYAWSLLATARFLQNEDEPALEAWNHAGEPRVDLVNVTGLARTRYRIVSEAAGIEPRTLLTPARLRTARRRVADVPALATARVGFHPIGGGEAQVDVAVVERDPWPRGWPAAVALGAGAAVDRTLAASFASPTGGGELVSAYWRWWDHRPAFGASIAAPAPAAWHATWRVDVARETETFAAFGRQTRTRASAGLGRWIGDRLRLDGSAGTETWRNAGRHATAGAAVAFWPVVDTWRVRVDATHWFGNQPFSTWSMSTDWQSSPRAAGQVWTARAGIANASAAAPPLVWPGADTGHVRSTLLRAHPLLDGGVISGGAFGRRLVSGGVEWRRWSRPGTWLVQFAPAAFVDVARATRGFGASDTRTQVDAGIGVRLTAGGAGVLRVDLAHGLRDGRTALSIVLER